MLVAQSIVANLIPLCGSGAPVPPTCVYFAV